MRPPARRATHSAVLRWLAVVIAAAMPGIGMGSLGGDVTSVEADRVHMKATTRTSQATLYTVHEVLSPYGTSVREFVSPAGIVFAVTWKGPFMPDLRQTLGAYFASYESAARAGRFGHSHVVVKQSELVVRSSGRPRAFFGIAYVPRLVPAGVPVDRIQ